MIIESEKRQYHIDRALTWCLGVDVESWPIDILFILLNRAVVIEVQGVVPKDSHIGLGLVVPAGNQEVSSPLYEVLDVSRVISPLIAICKRCGTPSKIGDLQMECVRDPFISILVKEVQ